MAVKKQGGWFKPYILNPHNIEKVVGQGPGVYVLGHIGPDKKFQVKHIRSSGNVKQELRGNLGKFHIFMYKPLKFHLNTFEAQQRMMMFS
jgi:hypothetical protein